MKNIQIIDGAQNCTYDIFCIDEEKFEIIFPDNHDIEFVEDLYERIGEENLIKIFSILWKNKVNKKEVNGIHGTLFFQSLYKKEFYPTKKEKEMIVKLLDQP